MALFPGAVLKLIPRHNKPLKASQLILHTAVSNASSLYGYFSNPNTDVASHFYIREDGTVEQYVDTRFQAPANYKANTSAISVETWDDLKPATTPWTARQMLSLVRLAVWAHEVHDVPYRLCPSPTSSGIGWHAMWGAPSAWTPAAGKVCPGPARIPQIASLVALAARPAPTPQEDLLSALTPDEQREVLDRLRNLDGIVTRSGLGSKLTSLVDGKTQGFLDNYILWADGKLDTIIKKLGN